MASSTHYALTFSVLASAVALQLGCNGDDPFGAGGSGAGAGSGASGAGNTTGSNSYPIVYQGFATLTTTYSITFGDQSSIECQATGAWTGTVTADEVILQGAVDQRANFDTGTTDYTTVCLPGNQTLVRRGSHDGERFTIEVPYESTQVTMTGSFGSEELLGAYDTTWTGVVAGFSEITKSEHLSLALPIQP
jgi:hypothetical protein